jgi:diguanylate cyclase (GGDEF)-like protein
VGVIVLTVLERLGFIPYAPLMAVEPTVNGSPSDWWVITWGGISLLVAIGLVAAFAWIMHEWRERDAMLEELSNTDGLTKLTNRRRFMEILEAECDRAKRTGRPLSMLMCDADHFKNINDTYGHHVGDQVLRVIASVLNDSVRVGTDITARLGGEEFALLLAETELESARIVAERVLEEMRKQSFTAAGSSFGVTLSIGLSTLKGEQVAVDVVMETSDALLYEAKNNGRDRIEAKAS